MSGSQIGDPSLPLKHTVSLDTDRYLRFLDGYGSPAASLNTKCSFGFS